jgi:hypothetical protein
MKKLLLLTTVTAVMNLALISSAGAATYGGDATGAEATVTATGTTIRAATGSLSISGGMADAALLVGDIPSSATGGVVSLTASALHSAVVGSGAKTRAESSMGAVGLTVSGNQFTADFLMARSAASCGPSVTGTSELVNLVINSQPITVTGSPNQTISLPNGSAIINAQVPTVGGTAGELSVTALRVMTHDTITGQPIADVLLSTVDAKIDCAGGSSPGQDWVTGGGWIDGRNGGKATFGFVAGPQDAQSGDIRGHFTLKDHGTGETIHGTAFVTFTECIGPTPNHSEFTVIDQATGNGETVSTNDNGEPGAGHDTFSIAGATYTNPGGTLRGGNIQAHGFTCTP